MPWTTGSPSKCTFSRFQCPHKFSSKNQPHQYKQRKQCKQRGLHRSFELPKQSQEEEIQVQVLGQQKVEKLLIGGSTQKAQKTRLETLQQNISW